MQDLLYKSVLIALNAGKITLKYHGKVGFDLKDDASPITQADLESNAYITQKLQEISSFLVCSEEAVLPYEMRKDLEYYWLIDPLDGTKDFLAQNGGFTINIALICKNAPILGVVYAPFFRELYFALKGFGSYAVDGELLKKQEISAVSIDFIKQNQIRLNGDRKLKSEKLLACDSMFHSTQETQDFLKKYDLDIIKKGSSMKVCTLAKGEADIYPRFNGTSEWDMAACDIILQEAGGVILDMESKKPLLYNKENVRNNHFIAFAKGQVGGAIYKDLF